MKQNWKRTWDTFNGLSGTGETEGSETCPHSFFGGGGKGGGGERGVEKGAPGFGGGGGKGRVGGELVCHGKDGEKRKLNVFRRKKILHKRGFTKTI